MNYIDMYWEVYFQSIRTDKKMVSQVCENSNQLCQNNQIMSTVGNVGQHYWLTLGQYTGELNPGGNPAMDIHPIQGGE